MDVWNKYQIEANKRPSVVILGQTGAGKSSLLNVLFGTDLAIGAARPVTRRPEPITLRGTNGHPLIFWDMPGIGESAAADVEYMTMYQDKLMSCDVVLWAVHADSRSTTYEALCLRRLLETAEPAVRARLADKLTLVMTKTDMLHPPPWVFSLNGDTGSFSPSRQLDQELEERAHYFEEIFLAPWGDFLTSTTYNPGGFGIADDRMSFTDHSIRYRGHFSRQVWDAYLHRYPEYADVFGRLRDNHRVVPCSARFRFNLTRIMVAVVNRLGLGAAARFQRLLGDVDRLSQVPVSTMRELGNFLIWDGGRKLLDLADPALPPHI